MEKHAAECPKRPYECPHCKETGGYQERTTKHQQECAKMEVVCPNEGCTERALRCDLPKHRQKCPRELVLCKYAYLGCNEILPREEITEHQKEQQNFGLEHKHTYMYTKNGIVKCILGESCILFIYIVIHSDYTDQHLRVSESFPPTTPPWYSRTITLEVLNQLEDDNHFRHSFTLGNGHNKELISLPFLGHNSATNCQYLKNDKLWLRISAFTPKGQHNSSY